MKVSSPFTKYFHGIISSCVKLPSNEINSHYSPNAFNIIKSKIHLVTLWSGLMLRVCQSEFKTFRKIDETSPFFDLTRLSNNNVESYFKYLKHDLLKLNERKRANKMMLSEILIPIQNDLTSKYIEYQYGSLLSQIIKKRDEKQKEDEEGNVKKETAFDLKELYHKATDKVPFQRKKGYYYENILKFNTNGKYNYYFFKPINHIFQNSK